jgi:hypothetical protein
MSEPAFTLGSVPDPHWWQRATGTPSASAATGAGVEGTPAEPVDSGAAGASLPFWALLGFTFVLLIAPQNIIPALRPLRLDAGRGHRARRGADRLGAACRARHAPDNSPRASWRGRS